MTKLPVVLMILFGMLLGSQGQSQFNFQIGDFNNDGCDDILQQKLIDTNKNAVTLAYYYPNKRVVKFFLGENLSLAGNFVNLLVGDFNGDGKDDILRQEKGWWADDRLGTAQLLLSTDLGNFSTQEIWEDYHLRGDDNNLYIGDFNRDGLDDILKQEKGAADDDQVGTAFILLSDGTGEFKKVDLPEYFYISGDNTNLYIGDFNGDGKDDILRQEKAAADDDQVLTACVLLSHDDNTFIQILLPEDLDIGGDYTNLYIGDFNGDGNDDILRQEKGAAVVDGKINTANMLFYDGEGAFKKILLSEDFTLSGDWTSLYVGDFNGDGKDDILRQERLGWSEDRLGTAHLLLSTGDDDVFNMIHLSEDLNIGGNGKLYVGDFNGDGNDDFIHDDGSSTPKLFYSNGVDGFTKN